MVRRGKHKHKNSNKNKNDHGDRRETDKKDDEECRNVSNETTVFAEGMEVEVRSIHKVGGLSGEGWFPATIIEPPTSESKGMALVRYESLLSEINGPLLRGYVVASFIRPLPPANNEKKLAFEQHDVVDALLFNGWWKGVVSEVRILEEKDGSFKAYYNVVFEDDDDDDNGEDHPPPRCMEFVPSKLRSHWDWTNGSWVRSTNRQDMSNNLHCQESLGYANNNLEVTNQPDCSNVAKECVEEESTLTILRKDVMEQSSPGVAGSKNKKVNQMECDCNTVLSRPSKKSKKNSVNPLTIKPIDGTSTLIEEIDQENLLIAPDMSNRPHVESKRYFTVTKGVNLQNDDDEGQQQSEGEGHDIASSGITESGFANYARKTVNSLELMGLQDALLETTDVVSPRDNQAREVSIAAAAVTCCNTPNAGDSPGRSFNKLDDRTERHIKTLMKFSVINVPEKSEQVEHQWMPFTKSSPLWEKVESLEVFQLMPQNPHFHPLIGCNEPSREGIAIGHMVTFANLVEKISKLRVDDPKDRFDGYLKILADMETYGFDVKAVVDRVNMLLTIKDKQGKDQDELKELQSQIAERAHESSKLEEDIGAIDKHIWELKQKRAIKMSIMEMNNGDITTWQLDTLAVRELLLEAEHEFESVARTPWKLPN